MVAAEQLVSSMSNQNGTSGQNASSSSSSSSDSGPSSSGNTIAFVVALTGLLSRYQDCNITKSLDLFFSCRLGQ
jgi:hypothetical protein